MFFYKNNLLFIIHPADIHLCFPIISFHINPYPLMEVEKCDKKADDHQRCPCPDNVGAWVFIDIQACIYYALVCLEYKLVVRIRDSCKTVHLVVEKPRP